MNLKNINFTQKDVNDFMNKLDINAILTNIDHMPSDNDYTKRKSFD